MDRRTLSERSVDYGLEMVDELPERTHNSGSPLEDQLRRILYDAERHAPKWGRIGAYHGANHAASAASSVQSLRRKHGDHPEVEGWRFETRRCKVQVDDKQVEGTGIFAQYTPGVAIPGKREENQVEYEKFKARQAEAKRIRDEEKAKKEAAAAKTVVRK